MNVGFLETLQKANKQISNYSFFCLMVYCCKSKSPFILNESLPTVLRFVWCRIWLTNQLNLICVCACHCVCVCTVSVWEHAIVCVCAHIQYIWIPKNRTASFQNCSLWHLQSTFRWLLAHYLLFLTLGIKANWQTTLKWFMGYIKEMYHL